MIKCPKCNKPDGLVLEQPTWINPNNLLDEYIEVQSYCYYCDINFCTSHEVGKVIKVYNVDTEAMRY